MIWQEQGVIGPEYRKPAHCGARSCDLLPCLQCGIEQLVRTVGGVVLGARVELEQPACLAQMPCPWPHMTQVQLSVWEVQDRDGVWRERAGRKGWDNTSISIKLTPGPTEGKRREEGDLRNQGMGLGPPRHLKASLATLGGCSQLG